MRQLNALGRTGGTGCVDDCGEHVAMRSGAAFLELCVRHPFAQFLDGVDRAGLQHVDVAQRGAFVLDGFHLVALLIVFGEYIRDCGIIADRPDLQCGIGFVNRHRHAADRHDGEIQRRPLPGRVSENAHAVARHEAFSDESLGDGDDEVAELRGRESGPFAV